MISAEDYYDDDGMQESFDDYIPQTTDPGAWMLVGVCLYSLICTCILPILVICGNRREKSRLDRKEWDRLKKDVTADDVEDGVEERKEDIANIGAIETECVRGSNSRATKIQTVSERRSSNDFGMQHYVGAPSALGSRVGSSISNHSSIISTRSKRHRGRGRMNYANLYSHAIESEEMYDLAHPTYTNTNRERNYASGLYAKNADQLSAAPTYDDIRPEDAADANDPGLEPSFRAAEEDDKEITICCGPNAICSKRNWRNSFGVLADIAHIDNETKRILQIGWPMTLSEAIGAVYEVMSVAIVSNYLGNDSLIAYIITDLLIGLTDTFLAGPADALNTVCSHAVGAENYKLAGQYVQIAAVLYLLLGVPMLGVWYIWIGDVARLMGFPEDVVAITAEYAKIMVWHYLLSGLFDGYNSLLDVTGYVMVGSIFDIIYGAINVAVLWILCAYWDNVTLYWIGFSELMVSVTLFLIYTAVVVVNGWLDRFMGGMIGSFALFNGNAVKNVVATSIPLSFGSLLEYGEWELLTFFVAYLGNAEVAAWGLLESLWSFFESATNGLSEAASIRVAYHLGNGNIEKAKMSSYKSLFMGVSLSFFITAFLFILGEDLATWFTPDVLLQQMLNDCIPMIGIANIFMIFGMIAWTLVGAQGRYRLATIVSACMSFFVTLPLAALSSFYFMFDLKGIVGAVICGYSTTGLWLGYILLRSDWEHISEVIQEYNAEEESSSEDESDLSEDEDDNDGSESDVSYEPVRS